MSMDDIENSSDNHIDTIPERPVNKSDRVIGACKAITLKFSSNFLTILFPEDETYPDNRGELAEEDESGQLVNSLSGLDLKKDKIVELFDACFSRQLRNILLFSMPISDAAAIGAPDSLSLVNETQLEESLAVDNLVEKLLQHFNDEIYCLQQRFSHLYPNQEISSANLPFGPEHFCIAFQEMMRDLGLELKFKLYLFKLLDKVLIKESGSYYHELNALLIAEDVLPTLKRTFIKEADTARQTRVIEENTLASGMIDSESPQKQDILQNSTQVYQAIQQLLALNDVKGLAGNMASEPSPASGASEMFSVTPMLLDSLSTIQQNFTNGTIVNGQDQGALKDQVNAMLTAREGSGNLQGINQIDNETIDVISMIFDLILDDKSLPDAIKVLLGRLQIPILKAAIIDRGFFKQKSHPARQLINKLAYAGVGWSEDSEAAKDRLYEKMESTVFSILNDFENDLDVFKELLSEFNIFIEKEKKEFEIAQEEVRQEALRKKNIEKHKRKIASLIIEKTKDKNIPDEILEFLIATWSRVIVEVTASNEASGPDDEESLQLVDDLVWSLSPKDSAEQRKKMILQLPDILKVITEGLERIDYGSEKSNKIFEVLERHHFSVLKNTPAERETIVDERKTAKTAASSSDATVDKLIDGEIESLNNEIELLPDLDGDSYNLFGDMKHDEISADPDKFEKMMAEMGLAHEVDPGPRTEDEFTELVRGLKLGAWVELTSDNGKTFRAKLAWQGDQFTKFSFMNRHYKVIAERPLFVLADEFRQGSAALVDAPDLFDRALEGVISGIIKVVK